MDDRGAPEAVVPVPARRLRECEVNLHLGAAETEALSGFADLGRDVAGPEQTSVQLGRCHVADDSTSGVENTSVRQTHAGRTAAGDDDALDVLARLARAAVILDQPDERVHEARTTAARDGHPAGLDCERDHPGHEPGRGGVRPEAGVEHPRGEQPVRAFGAEGGRQPVAAALHEVPAEFRQTSASEFPVGLDAEVQAGA